MDSKKDFERTIKKVRKAEALLKEAYEICNKHLDEEVFADTSTCIGNAIGELYYV